MTNGRLRVKGKQGNRKTRFGFVKLAHFILNLMKEIQTGEIVMPTYEFDCEKCGNKFTLIITMREYEKEKDRFRCPKCKSRKVKQILSPFVAKTTHKA